MYRGRTSFKDLDGARSRLK